MQSKGVKSKKIFTLDIFMLVRLLNRLRPILDQVLLANYHCKIQDEYYLDLGYSWLNNRILVGTLLINQPSIIWNTTTLI